MIDSFSIAPLLAMQADLSLCCFKVVSLALILQNPAPSLPESGTRTNRMKIDRSHLDGFGWDPDFVSEGASGSILSCGTLVVVRELYLCRCSHGLTLY